MQKTIASVVGAVGALSVAHSASGAPATAAIEHSIANPASYKELLQPIPNASALLRKIEAEEASRPGEILEVQYWAHHHHHHHHAYYPRTTTIITITAITAAIIEGRTTLPRPSMGITRSRRTGAGDEEFATRREPAPERERLAIAPAAAPPCGPGRKRRSRA